MQQKFNKQKMEGNCAKNEENSVFLFKIYAFFNYFLSERLCFLNAFLKDLMVKNTSLEIFS